MISARRANPGLALILAAMAASSLRSSARIVLAIAAKALATMAGGRCSPCCSIRPSSSFKAVRAWTSRSTSSRAGSCGWASPFGKRLGEPGDRLGVDRIVLGQPPGRFGKAANPLRIDDEDLDAGRAQGFRPAPLITAARLHHRPADPVFAQPCDQLGLAFRGARRRQARPTDRMQASTLFFATSRPTTRVCCGILPLPSLLVRALTPMQLFGFKEDARPVPRFPAAFRCGGHGLRSGDGRLLRTAARSPTLHSLRTQGVGAQRRLSCAPRAVRKGAREN